jgi:hypothetical protein
MSESRGRKIYYISASKDFRGDEQHNRVYYGLTFRVKVEQFTTPAQAELEQQVMDTITAWITRSPVKGYRVSDDPTIERFETFHVETGDIIVMYRIPFEAIP